MIGPALGIAVGTLASEDLACIAAGLLVARGEMGFAAAVTAAFGGIFVGDLLLYGAGRWLGRPALARAPLRWIASPDDVRRASAWLERRGPVVILASRFLPGSRLPAYVAAGALHTSLRSFVGWFALAAALWTPLLVGAAAIAGASGMASAEALRRSVVLHAAVVALAVLLALRLVVPLLSRRGRRLLRSSWLRLTRWEFWPSWVVYAPVAAYAVWLGLRRGGLTLFTAANPGIESGGFVGESKGAILASLARGGAPVARFRTLPASLPVSARVEVALRFLESEGLGYPVVIKPDVGERGRGVAIVRDREELARRVAEGRRDLLVQEYVGGPELGVFYYRFPGEERGRILSVTEKRLPVVVADGARTVERLVLDDERGILMARFHLARLADRLDEVPPRGAHVPLAVIGNHCRGAIFLDGARHATPELVEAIDRAARGFAGFHFGRFDVRGTSLDAIGRGEEFRILELNGVSSESTHIYDPGRGIVAAWRALFSQWRIAFAIGAANRELGFAPTALGPLLRQVRAWRLATR